MLCDQASRCVIQFDECSSCAVQKPKPCEVRIVQKCWRILRSLSKRSPVQWTIFQKIWTGQVERLRSLSKRSPMQWDHISANKGKTRREIEKLGFWLSLLIKVVGWILCVYVASWCKDATTSYFLVCTYYASIPLSLYFVLRICMDIKMRNGWQILTFHLQEKLYQEWRMP